MHLSIQCAAFAVGVALGLARPDGPWLMLAALVACALAASLLILDRAPPPTQHRTLCLLLLALGVLRALGAVPVRPRIHPPDRPSTRLQEFRVEGASQPGPRCRVDVRGEVGARAQLVSSETAFCEISSGQRIRVLTIVRPEPSPRPGFDPGGTPRLHVERWWVTGQPHSSYWGRVAALRRQAWEASQGRPELGLLAAAGLGLRQALPAAERRALQRSGLGHLVAISGLHVALLAALAHFVALRGATLLGRGPSVAVVVAAVPVVAYVFLTGAAPPAIRAAGLIGVFGLGIVLGRPVHAPTALAQVLALMLAARPEWLLEPGFQLSAAAMAALVSAPSDSGPLRTSWRVAWALAPLELAHFGAVPLHGVLLNLVAIPVFAGWVLPAGLIGLALLPTVGVGALEPAAWGARLLLDLAAFGAEIPPTPVPWLAALAGSSLLAHGVLLGSDRHALWARTRGWLVPMPAAVALLGGWLVAIPVTAPPGHWIAWGSWRSPTIVRVEPRRVCVHRPGGAATSWSRIARESRWPVVVGVAGTDGRARALRDELRRDGAPTWLVRCPGEPPRAALREALRACASERGGSRGAVRIVDGRAPACFLGDRWRPLATPGPREGT